MADGIPYRMTSGRMKYLAEQHWELKLEIPSPTKKSIHTQYFGTKQLSWLPSMTEAEMERLHISPDPRTVRVNGLWCHTGPDDSEDNSSPVIYTESAKLFSSPLVTIRNHSLVREHAAIQKVDSNFFIDEDVFQSTSRIAPVLAPTKALNGRTACLVTP